MACFDFARDTEIDRRFPSHKDADGAIHVTRANSPREFACARMTDSHPIDLPICPPKCFFTKDKSYGVACRGGV